MANDKCTTPVGVLCFLHAETPDEKGKYGSMVVWPPGTDISELEEMVQAQVEASKVKNKKVLNLPFRDGEEKEHLGWPFVEGSKFITAKSQFKPGAVDKDVNVILDRKSELYSGILGRLQVHAYEYDVDGNKGITFGLDHIQKVKDGENLGGTGGDPTQAFEPVEVNDIL